MKLEGYYKCTIKEFNIREIILSFNNKELELLVIYALSMLLFKCQGVVVYKSASKDTYIL